MGQKPQVSAREDEGIRQPRVLIVSDVLLYRDGLCASLSASKQLEVVGSATGLETIERVKALCPEVVILDASLSNSLSLARHLRSVFPEVRIVGIGISIDDVGILSCAEAGLAGFVGRDATAQDLVAVVDSSMRGELHCSPRVAALIFNRVASLATNDPRVVRPASLTRREIEIAILIREGLSNKEIASKLHIAPATVKNYVHNILEKLSIRRRSAVAVRLRG